MVSRSKVRWRVAQSAMHTIVSLLVMVAVMGGIVAISLRFGGVRIVLPIIEAGALMAVLSFLLAEPIITFVFKAIKPDPEKHQRFIDAVERVRLKHWMFRPRLRILKFQMGDIDVPNAAAFGWGVFGQYCVGITESLLDILDDDELEAVVAHEIGHIRCWDVGIMGTLIMITGSAEKLSTIFLRGETVLGRGPVALVLGAFFYLLARIIIPIGRSAISQEREFTADALAALDVGSTESLKRALGKLGAAMQKVRPPEKENDRIPWVFDDLFISHPRMEQRLSALDALEA